MSGAVGLFRIATRLVCVNNQTCLVSVCYNIRTARIQQAVPAVWKSADSNCDRIQSHSAVCTDDIIYKSEALAKQTAKKAIENAH